LLFANDVQPDSKIIATGVVGPYQLGMKIDELKARTGQERLSLVDLNSEGLFSPAIILSTDKLKRSLLCSISMNHNNEWVLSSITVLDPQYHASGGIGVGSTFINVEEAYPSIKIFDEEGGRGGIDERSGLSFAIGTYGPIQSAVVKAIRV
jgi:hypothetical protein